MRPEFLSSTSTAFRLLVGLGNPGSEYEETRHNAGFMVLDRIAAKAEAVFRREKQWQAAIAKAGPVMLCKPLTYMNASGSAVRAVGDFFKVGPSEILVILDDMALPLGTLRLRSRGSSGGHNGLQSVIDCLGTTTFARLRIGIGMVQPGGAVDHVLGRFAAEEKDALRQSLDRAIEAVDCTLTRGLKVAMNSFN